MRDVPGVRRRWLGLLAVTLLIQGCGEDTNGDVWPGEDRDAAVSSPEGGAQVDPPTPPDLPDCLMGEAPSGCAEAPVLDACDEPADSLGCPTSPVLPDWTCAPGFKPRRVGDEDDVWAHSVCDTPSPPSCPNGEVAFLGETSCRTIGTTCPAGEFHDDSTLRALAPGYDGAIWYIQQGAAGDGSASSPFGSIADALGVAQDGDVIALSTGNHVGPALLDRRVALVGSCVGTSLAGDGATPVVTVTGAEALVANLRLVGPGIGMAFMPGADGSAVRNIEVIGASRAGIGNLGAFDVTLAGAIVRETMNSSPTEEDGFGIGVMEGSLSAEQCVLERNHTYGAAVGLGASMLRLNNTVVRETQSRPSDGKDGGGVSIGVGGTLFLSGCLIENNRRIGIAASEGTANLEDVVVRDTAVSDDEGLQGVGLLAKDGAIVSATRVLLERNHSQAVLVLDPSSLVAGDGVVLSDTGMDTGFTGGGAAYVDAGSVVLKRAALLQGWGSSAAAAHGGHLTVEDAVVFAIAPRSDDQSAEAVAAYSGGKVLLDRVILDRAEGSSMLSSGTGSRLTATDVTAIGTSSSEDGLSAGSVGEVRGGGTMEVDRVRAFDHQGNLQWRATGQGTNLTVRDAVIDRPVEGWVTQGLYGALGAHVEFERVRAVQLSDMAFAVSDPTTELHLRDTVVEDTTLGSTDYGAAVVAIDGASVFAERCVFRGNRSGDVMVMGKGTSFDGGGCLFEGVAPEVGSLPFGGIAAMDEAGATLRGARMRRNVSVGAAASGRAVLELNDVVIEEPRSDPESLEYGMGVIVFTRSRLEMNRCQLDRTRGVGVLLPVGDGEAKLTDVVIDTVLEPECAALASSDPRRCGGLYSYEAATSGVLAQGASRVDMLRFEISGAHCGVWINESSVPNLEHGLIRNNLIGVNLRSEFVDMSAVAGPTIRFLDNDTNVESMDLQIPSMPEVPSSLGR